MSTIAKAFGAAIIVAAGFAPLAAVAQAAPLPGTTQVTTYKNCTEVREAGKAPLHKGEDGYESKLDRDGDGIACE